MSHTSPTNIPRVVILVMDSVGIGQAHDAKAYDDLGADTLGHIVEAAAAGRADGPRRQGPLQLPQLDALGLGAAAQASRGAPLAAPLGSTPPVAASYAYAAPDSLPKGSTGGHWEIAGLKIGEGWGHFGADPAQPYPPALIEALIAECDLPGVICVGRISGTDAIEQYGDAHCQSGRPIIYTSADSVFQIAAHEKTFGLDKLYDVCAVARRLCDEYRIARVIARPFVGEHAADFERTDHRRDFSMPPHGPTLLDRLTETDIDVTTIGKIGDLFAHRGISREYPVTALDAVVDQTVECLNAPAAPGLIFVNFCDFDSKYGHRRDVAGYARELECFDRRLPDIQAAMQAGDLLIITADHGNDPTYRGSDHTRENVPVLLAGAGVVAADHGRRSSFADVGATAARHLGIADWPVGESLLYGDPA